MNRPKSYARLQKEAEEGNERLPENHGYGGKAVSTRPAKRARVQVEEHEDEALRKEDEKSLHAMGLDANKLREIRSQYGSEERGGAERIADARPAHRKRSATRCRPLQDCGATTGSDEGAKLFCLDFARGRCPDGPQCTHRHEIPRPRDDEDLEILNEDYDIFGRKRSLLTSHWERHHGKKEEGANALRLTALFVTGLRAPARQRTELCGGRKGSGAKSIAGDLDSAVRKAFGAFGEVVETRVVLDSVRGHKCTVAYSSRSAAEFAKEAMTGQSLRPDGGELVQVRWAKEQASTSETGKFSFVDVHAGRAKAPAARAGPPAAPPAESLPEGWCSTHDASSKRTYYHDEDGSHVTWARPTERAPSVAHLPPLPPGWRRHFDAARGCVYYHHTSSDETTWDRPS